LLSSSLRNTVAIKLDLFFSLYLQIYYYLGKFKLSNSRIIIEI